MSALYGALAFTQADHVAVLVGQNLEFDMPWVLDIFLHVQIAIAKRSCRFLLRLLVKRGQLFFRPHDAHAAAAAASRSFDDDGIAHLPAPLPGFVLRSDHTVGSRQNRHTMLLHGGPRLFLLAHQANDLGRRSNELQPAGLADFGKVRVFREQSVAGMNCIRVCDFRRADDRWNIEIAQPQLWGPDTDGFVCETDGQRVTIRLAVNRHRADAQFLAGTNDAQGDFPSVGNQDLLKHAFKFRALSYELRVRKLGARAILCFSVCSRL